MSNNKHKYNLQLFGAMEDPAAKALEINQQAKDIWKSTKALEMMDYFKVAYLQSISESLESIDESLRILAKREPEHDDES